MSSILFVHPDVKIGKTVCSLLEKGGHRISSALDGAGALAAYKCDKPDIVILNREFPAMAGFQVFSEIKALDPQAKVLLFSVQRTFEYQKAPAKFGIPAFGPGEVLRVVEALQSGARRPGGQGARFASRVLVVDDDPEVLNTVRRFLTEKEYEVAVASNGLDALPLLKKLRPHLVLLDIDMPKMNGIETLKRIRELDDQVAVMMITGDGTLEMMKRCRELGAYDYLLKPVNFPYLEFSVYSKILMMTL
ncbi:MAG: response regulator [Elusimicrobiota bacterium]